MSSCCLTSYYLFFFFKQKTAYEMRISDWSSDVCSSDLAESDVLIHNFRPGIMERLGLGWDALSALNPRLIYAGVSGYGPAGPWRDRPGQDLLVQSLSGIAWLSGDADGPPVPAGLSITDMMAGAQLAQGILALLVRRGGIGRANG